jgi:hypothetical protein
MRPGVLVLGEFGAFRRCAVHSLLGLPGVLGEFGAFPPSTPSSVFPEYSAGSVPSVCPPRLPTPSSVFRSVQCPLQHTQSQPRLSGRSLYEAKAVYLYIYIYGGARLPVPCPPRQRVQVGGSEQIRPKSETERDRSGSLSGIRMSGCVHRVKLIRRGTSTRAYGLSAPGRAG